MDLSDPSMSVYHVLPEWLVAPIINLLDKSGVPLLPSHRAHPLGGVPEPFHIIIPPIGMVPPPENVEAVTVLATDIFVDSSVPDTELNVRLDPVFGPIVPVDAVANIGKQVVSDDSSATVRDNAVEAVPVNVPVKFELPPTYKLPPVILMPALAVTIPIASTFLTSS